MSMLNAAIDAEFLLPSTFLIVVLSVVAVVLGGAVCISGCNYHKRTSRKHNELKVCQNGTCVEHAVDIDQNGDVQNGRPLSHDRALPDIPATASGVASTDDDEVEDGESHYDVIPKKQRLLSQMARDSPVVSAAAANQDLLPTGSQPKKGSHPYEIVGGDLDSDSTYAGIREDSDSVLPSGDRHIACSTAVNISRTSGGIALAVDPLYAGIADDGSSLDSARIVSNTASAAAIYSSVGGRNATQQHCGAEYPLGSATNDLELNFMPSIPDRRYDSELNVERSLLSSDSPLLPPRNGNGNGDGLTRVPESSISSRAQSVVGTGSAHWNVVHFIPDIPVATTNDVNIGAMEVAAAVPGTSSAAEETKRVPNYSSVTARESLENLRRRQQLEQQQQLRAHQRSSLMQGTRLGPSALQETPFIDSDGTYDTIDYDLVRTPVDRDKESNSQAVMMVDGNVYNNGSDLYAEISTGPSSAHSSTTYARVSDFPTDPLAAVTTSSTGGPLLHAPMPPSVDTLQHLTHSSSDDVDSIVDPGYSRVDRPRPFTIHSTVELQSADASNSRGRRSPVYAVVSKPSRRPKTVGDGDRVDSSMDYNGASLSHTTPLNTYAQVSKSNRHRRAMSHDTAQVSTSPLVMQTRWNNSSMQSNSGYATIDGMSESDSLLLRPDVDYDTVGDPVMADGDQLGIDFDPNYETVIVPSTAANQRAGNNAYGVAREISSSVPSSSANQNLGLHSFVGPAPDWVHPRPPLIREHIYQEVTGSSRYGARESRPESRHSDFLTTDL